MSSLDGTFTFEEMNDMTMLVSKDLKLDVTWFIDILLQEDGIITKSGFRLSFRTFNGLFQLGLFMNNPHSFSSAARGRLH